MELKEAYIPDDFPIFKLPDSSRKMAKEWGAKVRLYFMHNVVRVLGIKDVSEVKLDQDIFYEIFARIEKRRVYFHIYHGMEMGEINEGALICFWILKLMPFRMEGMPTSVLNTRMAYIVFVNLLHYVANKTKLHINVKSKLMTDLMYAFQYRDLSKEAIMALAESHLY